MSEVRDKLLDSLRWLKWATVVLYVVMFLAITGFWINAENRSQDIARVAENTNNALCVFRGDLEQRAEQSVQFLKDHPNGIPGISAETIQQGIDNQKRTIDALSSLEC